MRGTLAGVWLILAACAVVHGAAAQAGPRALVVVVSDGGLPADSAMAARRIVVSELAKRRYEVLERPELQGVHALDQEVMHWAEAAGADEIFALGISRFGKEWLVELTLHSRDLTQVRGERLSAEGPEELDEVIPRLAAALALGAPSSLSAEVDTVTDQEAEQWKKKPGEFLFGIGILVGGAFLGGSPPIYGLDLKLCYEMKHFRINGEISGGLDIPDVEDYLARVGIGVTYLPLALDWSPYVGASVNYMFLGIDEDYNGGVGFDVHAGVELFRLHRARFLFEFGVALPIFKPQDRYAAIGHGAAAVLW